MRNRIAAHRLTNRPHTFSQFGSACSRIGGKRRQEFEAERFESVGQGLVWNLLSVAQFPPGVLEQLAGIGYGREAHHSGGALDGVPLAAHVLKQSDCEVAGRKSASSGGERVGPLLHFTAEQALQLEIFSRHRQRHSSRPGTPEVSTLSA